MSLEDVLAARNALELYESTHEVTPHSPPPIEEEDEEEEKEIKIPEVIEERSEPPSSAVSSVGHDELPSTGKVILHVDFHFLVNYRIIIDLITPPLLPPPPVKKVYKKRQKALPDASLIPQCTDLPKRSYNRTAGKLKRVNKPRSRTCTPQPENSPSQQSDEEVTPNQDNIATMLFDYFSPKARASSPPAKSRNPHSRMSISEMNRRANQILEYISSIQVEMATLHAGHEDDNDSLSSASTIPLDEEEFGHDNQSSLEIMDMLTRKLIKFQRRFGSRNRALYEEALIEGEGRITRSREASGNTNTYRNMIAH